MFSRTCPLSALGCLLLSQLFLLAPGLVAQKSVQMQPMCQTGCGGGSYAVDVTPHTATTVAAANTSGQTVQFTVHNTGTLADAYTLTCTSTGGITCTNISPTTLSLPASDEDNVTVTYSANSTGSGTLRLTATGGATAIGAYTMVDALPPVLSLNPYNGNVRSLEKCLAACFDVVWSHSTPSYFSMGRAQSLALFYNSSTVKSTPVIQVDVTRQTGPVPTSYKLEVRRAADNSLLTLLNGQTAAYFAASNSVATTRIAGALDARANGFGTGVTDITVTVTASFASAAAKATTVSTRMTTVDRTTSIFGSGVSAVPYAYTTGSGYYSMLFVEADGSTSFFYRPTATSAYQTPGGMALQVTQDGVAGWLRRSAQDGSYEEFSWATGRLQKVVDRFGTTTRYYWTAELLDSIVDPKSHKIALTYSGGKLWKATDPMKPVARVTTYTVDGSGRLSAVQDPDGVSSILGYDANGLLRTVTGRGGATSGYAYDALNRLQADTAPSIAVYAGGAARPVTTFAAAELVAWQPAIAGTSAGNPKLAVIPDSVRAVVTDPLGNANRSTIDAFEAPVVVTDAVGQVSRFTRDSMSRPIYVVAANGHATELTYTGYQLIRIRDVTTGRIINYTYTAAGDLATVSGDTPRHDYLYYNGSDGGPAGALKAEYLGNHGSYPTIYMATLLLTHKPDASGRDTATVDAAGHHNAFTYDSKFGMPAGMTDGGGVSTTVEYDGAGRDSIVHLPNGRPRTLYGIMNQVVSRTDARGNTDSTWYTPDLLVNRIKDAKHQLYKFEYNALGALTTKHDLADTTRADTLKYDVAGNLRSMRTRRGDLLTYTYDAAGRLLNRIYRSVGATVDTLADYRRYDPAGLWMVAGNAAQIDSLRFDAAGRLTEWSSSQSGQRYEWNYSYDIQDRLSSRQLYLNDVARTFGGVSNFYNSVTGLLDSTQAAGVRAIIGRDSDLLPNWFGYNWAAGTGWNVFSGIDPDHEFSGQTYSIATLNDAFGGDVEHDSLGHMTWRYEGLAGTPAVSYAYDSTGQFVGNCVYSNWPSCVPGTSYFYDAARNRFEGTSTTTTTTVASGNHVTAAKGSALTYDANGSELTKVGNGHNWSYTWDPFGKLVQVKDGATVVATLAYDAFDRRIATSNSVPCSSERYLFDGEHLAANLDCYGNLRDEYGWVPGSDRPMAIKNGNWTGVVLVDPSLNESVDGIANYASGSVIKRFSTGPWGEVVADTGVGVKLRMAGQQYDQSVGLYYMGQRYYDPDLGRFISEDPAGVEGGLNLYAYAGNDPINNSDPTGLDCEHPIVVNRYSDGAVHTIRCPEDLYRPATIGDLMLANSSSCLQGECWFRNQADDMERMLDAASESRPDRSRAKRLLSCGGKVLVGLGTIVLDVTALGELRRGIQGMRAATDLARFASTTTKRLVISGHLNNAIKMSAAAAGTIGMVGRDYLNGVQYTQAASEGGRWQFIDYIPVFGGVKEVIMGVMCFRGD